MIGSPSCRVSVMTALIVYYHPRYSHLEAARKETNPKLVLPLQCKNIVKDEKDRAFILVHWDKLCHLMEYLRGDCDRPLILGADNDRLLMGYVDALFAVHPNIPRAYRWWIRERISHLSLNKAKVEYKKFN